MRTSTLHHMTAICYAIASTGCIGTALYCDIWWVWFGALGFSILCIGYFIAAISLSSKNK